MNLISNALTHVDKRLAGQEVLTAGRTGLTSNWACLRLQSIASQLEPAAIDYVDGDATSREREPLQRLASDGQLAGVNHHGFRQPCDTLRDKRQLEELWNTGQASWRVWPG